MNYLLKLFSVVLCAIPLSLAAQFSEGITEVEFPDFDPENPIFFGRQTAIYENIMLAGTSNNMVYVFQNINDQWKKIKVLKPTNDDNEGFGLSLAIDKNTIAIGAPFAQTDGKGNATASQAGAVYIYTKSNGQWKQSQKIVSKDFAVRNQFGNSLDLHNGTLAIGAQWKNEIKPDGKKIMMAGAVYIFKKTSSRWSESQTIYCPVDKPFGINFGRNLKVHDQTLVCAGLSDDLFVFEAEDGKFKYKTSLKSSKKIGEYELGLESFDINDNSIICGAAKDNSNIGAAFVFMRQPDGTYRQTEKLTISDGELEDYFGSHIATEGDQLIISSTSGGNTEAPHCSCGAVYLYKMLDNKWVFQEKIMACDNGRANSLGFSTSIHNGSIVIGAPAKAIKHEDQIIKSIGTVFCLKR